MPSPFPGMDPYIESRHLWPDFHTRFITAWSEILADRLPDNYDARIEERVYVLELPDEEARLIRPDVTVMTLGDAASPRTEQSAVATMEPVVLAHCLIEEVTEPYIRILHRPDQTVVAVLELLSPDNKRSTGRGLYLEKRATVLSHAIHLVELDLLLGGQRLPMRSSLPAGHFYAFVTPAGRLTECRVYAWTVRDPFPKFFMPLKLPDQDLLLDLAEVFSLTYERGRYRRACDYSSPYRGPLGVSDEAWVNTQAKLKT